MTGRNSMAAVSRSFALAMVAVVIVAIALVVPGAPGEAGAATPPGPCTNPSTVAGFTPQDSADRYGIRDLVDAGDDGTGVTIAILEFGESYSPTQLSEYLDCMAVPAPTVEQVLVEGPSLPATGTEAQGDVEVIAGLVPGASIYVIVGQADTSFAALMAAAMDPANTGGDQVDIISSSWGECEQALDETALEQGDAALEQMADAGIWFLKSAGDAGSDECGGHPACPAPADPIASVEYPTSNPNVTGVGGTQIDDAATHGTATVWNDGCSAGGGGQSVLFSIPGFQQGFGPTGQTTRMVPDLSGLAGYPGYQILDPTGAWVEDGGTSFATPTYAAGFAAVLSSLQRRGIDPPQSLNEVLYAIAGDATAYAQVFTDVVTGDNDLLSVGCCVAGVGYDMASGLGEIDFLALHQWLVAQATPDDVDPIAPPVVPSDPTTDAPLQPDDGVLPASAVASDPRYTG